MMSKVQFFFLLLWEIAPQRGEKGGSAKFQNKAHITFDIIITYTPVYLIREVFDWNKKAMAL